MTPLRQQMIDAMQQRGFAIKTHKAYLGAVSSLRHAYATHQLEQGIAIHVLQQQLGHNDLHSTLRYVHWLPNYQQGKVQFSDLVGQLMEDRGHD